MNFGGIDIQPGALVTTFLGGMAYAVVLRVRDPWRLGGILIVGIGTSLSFGPLIVNELMNLGFGGVSVTGLANASGFVSGLGGMAICNGVIAVVNKIIGRKTAEADDAPIIPPPPPAKEEGK